MAERVNDTRDQLGGSRGIHVTERTEIDRPIDEVYAFWRDFSNLPRVMTHVRAITPYDSTRMRWVAEGPAGTSLEWDAEIINDVPGQVIGWRSLADADVVSAGSVNFDRTADGRTLVTVKMQYNPPAGRAGAWVAWLLGADPALQIAEDLQRLKTTLERDAAPDRRETRSAMSGGRS